MDSSIHMKVIQENPATQVTPAIVVTKMTKIMRTMVLRTVIVKMAMKASTGKVILMSSTQLLKKKQWIRPNLWPMPLLI